LRGWIGGSSDHDFKCLCLKATGLDVDYYGWMFQHRGDLNLLVGGAIFGRQY